jgi:hypothetical protein
MGRRIVAGHRAATSAARRRQIAEEAALAKSTFQGGSQIVAGHGRILEHQEVAALLGHNLMISQS